MNKRFLICQKLNYVKETKDKKHTLDTVTSHIRQQLLSAGYTECLKDDKSIDYVFAIGGDGTMLYAMRNYINHNCVVIGIHAGNVGFLPPYSIEDILSCDVVSLLENNPRIEKRSILSSELNHNKVLAVNEFIVSAPNIGEMIQFSFSIERDKKIIPAGKYIAQALAVSGPCGSTAYNKNIGGCILDPNIKCMQLTQVAPMSLNIRPLIISFDSIVHIQTHTDAKLMLDGFVHCDIKANETTKISLAPLEANILVPQEWNFYQILAQKLHWNNSTLP